MKSKLTKATDTEGCRCDSRRILVVTGTPGVGKSTVARLLASRTDAELISLGDLVKNEGLHLGMDRRRDTLIADLERLSQRVREMIDGKPGNAVVEGHYAAEVVSPSGVRLVFVLRRDPSELKSVLTCRGYGKEKVRENSAAEILDVCLYDAVKRCGVGRVCEIDATGRKAEDVAEEILLVLEGKRECRVGVVDWLGRLEAKGELDRYLREF